MWLCPVSLEAPASSVALLEPGALAGLAELLELVGSAEVVVLFGLLVELLDSLWMRRMRGPY